MPGSTKVNGSWKTASGLSVKVSGTWRTATSAFIKVGGVWKQWFASVITDNFSRSSTATGLGTSETGQPWTSLIGDWRVSGSNSAISDNSSALAAVNFGSPDVIVSASVSVGTGPAFWISDAGSYWASYVHSTSTSTPYQYNYSCNCQTLYNPGSPGGCSGQCYNYVDPVPGGPFSYTPVCCSCTCNGSDPGGGSYETQGTVTWYRVSGTTNEYIRTCSSGVLEGTTCRTTTYVCNSSIYSLLSGTRCYSTANFYSYVDATATNTYTTADGFWSRTCPSGGVAGGGGGSPYTCYDNYYTPGATQCNSCTGTSAGTPGYNSYFTPSYPACSCSGATGGSSSPYGPTGGYYYQACETCTGTGYNVTNYYTLRLIKSIGGAVSQATGEISLSSAASSIRVTTAGDSVVVSAYSGEVGISSVIGTINHTASAPNKGVSVGLIKQSSSANQGSTADTFSAKIQGA